MRPSSARGFVPLLLLLAAFAATVSAAAGSQNQRVVCYYTNWSVYRPGNAKFSPQNINPYLCTHLIYAFGGLTKENGLRPFDKYQDIEQGGYAKFNGLKSYNKELKTLLAIGGWNEGSARFSPLVADAERRTAFVKNVVRFLRTNHFDGLDLDWEYPAFRDGGKPRDRMNYALLVQELRAEFERESSKTGRERLLLTMAVPAGTEYVDKGYDVPSLNKHLDFFNILSYDYHSAFEPVVNHHAPLYSGGDPDNEYNFDAQLSIEHSIKHYLTLGADADKLVLGIPTYGRSYTLFNPLATELGSAADGPGEQGDATREKGYLAYYEICENVKKEGWTVEIPKPDEMGPIAYKGNQWVGYDDEEIVRVKARYVAARGLGGIMFWSIDNDDFRGKCHGRPYPLIEAGKEALLAATKPTATDSKRTKPVGGPRRRPSTSSATTAVSTAGSTSTKRRRPTSSNSRVTERPITTSTTTPLPPNLSLLNTPEPPTTPDSGSDFRCEDEGFYPHPRDCKKYFWCLDSGPSQLGIVAHQFTCPSGLVFNKLADSCDYARNVVCNKVSKTTTEAPTTVAYSTTERASTRSPLFRTTTTTTTTTTQAPEPEEEEYEYEDDIEEDPKAIKELLDLIKRLGGVEQLEKQFGGARGIEEAPVVMPERPNISKSLYERVLSGRGRISNSGGGLSISSEKTKSEETDRKPPASLNTRSRGPQNKGLEDLEEVRGVRKEKLKYVELDRRTSRPSPRPVSEEDEGELEETEEEEETAAPPRSKTRVSNTTPKYVSIRRERPSSTAAPEPESELEEEEETREVVQEQPKRKYSILTRPRVTSPAPKQEILVEEISDEEGLSGDLKDEDEEEVPAIVREIPAPSPLEFEGRVEEITKAPVSTTSTTEVLSTTTTSVRPALRPLPSTRRPFNRVRVSSSTLTPRTTTEEVLSEEVSSTTARPRVVLRRKFRPFSKEGEKSPSRLTAESSSASPRSALVARRRLPVSTTSTEEPAVILSTAAAETSPLMAHHSPAIYYTRQPLEDEEHVTEPFIVTAPDADLDLINVEVAALTNLATAPPSAPARYDDVSDLPEEVINVELGPSTFATTTTHKPRGTPPPRKAVRAQRPASTVVQQQPFTRLRGPAMVRPAVTKTTRYSTTHAPPDFEDYYDDEQDPLAPSNSNKVKIHEDGSLECLDRGNFAHPFSCRKFISCALMENGALLGWIYTCPKHLAFDPIGGICNWSGGCKE